MLYRATSLEGCVAGCVGDGSVALTLAARAQQSRGKDFGVVHHHQIAWAKKIRKVRDGCVPNLARLSVEHEEA